MDPNQPVAYPIFFRFAKTGLMRFVGHLDWQAMQAVMFLRAGLPMSVGEGPTHKLKIKTSPPTPVGVESRAEFTYILLSEPLYPDIAVRLLQPHCPIGIEVTASKDAGFLVRKNPFGTIEASGYQLDLGEGVSPEQVESVFSILEKMKSLPDNPPEGMAADDIKPFWGRVIELSRDNGKINLLVKQMEGDTFHGAKCASFLEEHLHLPHYPIFTKLDYYRLKPSKRKLFR